MAPHADEITNEDVDDYVEKESDREVEISPNGTAAICRQDLLDADSEPGSRQKHVEPLAEEEIDGNGFVPPESEANEPMLARPPKSSKRKSTERPVSRRRRKLLFEASPPSSDTSAQEELYHCMDTHGLCTLAQARDLEIRVSRLMLRVFFREHGLASGNDPEGRDQLRLQVASLRRHEEPLVELDNRTADVFYGCMEKEELISLVLARDLELTTCKTILRRRKREEIEIEKNSLDMERSERPRRKARRG